MHRQNSHIAWLLICFVLSAQAGPASRSNIDLYHQWITAALERAYRGDNESPSTGAKMRKVFTDSTDAGQRATAAYLLTLNDKQAKPFGVLPLTQAALAYPDPSALLGPQAHARLLRTRADARYNQGKFEDAEADFARIAEISEGVSREYALLKRGWCIFNRNLPGDAFAYWSQVLRERGNEVHASATWFHSLGQSLAENQKRTTQDVRILDSLCDTPEKQKDATAGLLEGAESLLTFRELSALASVLAEVPWYPTILDTVATAKRPRGRDACLALSWMQSDPREALTLPGHLELVESCSSWADSGELEVRQSLLQVAPRLTLRGDARRVRTALFAKSGADREVCLEGLQWLEELSVPREFPGVEIASSCKKSSADDLAERAAELAVLRAVDPAQLRGGDSVYPFLFSELFRDGRFRAAFFERWEDQPERFRETDLPQILAERSFEYEDFERAGKLFAQEGVARGGVKNAKNASIWDRIADYQLVDAMGKGDLGESFRVLEQSFPLRPDGPPNAAERAAWAKWILSCKQSDASQTLCGDATEKVLASSQGSAADYALFIDFGIDCGRIEAVTAAIARLQGWEKVPAPVRAHAENQLFSRWFDSAPTTQATLPASVRFVSVLADKLRAGEFRDAVEIAPSGNSAVAQDLSEARRLEKQARQTLRATQKKALLIQIPQWVGYLKKELPRIQRREWSHPSLSELGFTTVREFCREASEQLKKHPPQSLEGQWQQAYTQLQTRFADCRSAAGETAR